MTVGVSFGAARQAASISLLSPSISLALALSRSCSLSLYLPLPPSYLPLSRSTSIYLPLSPSISLYLPVPPCISLYLPLSPSSSLHLPVPPCTSLSLLYLPLPPCISLYLPVSPSTPLYLPLSPSTSGGLRVGWGAGERRLPIEAEDAFLSSPTSTREDTYSAVLTVLLSVVFTRCSQNAAQYRLPALRLECSARRRGLAIILIRNINSVHRSILVVGDFPDALRSPAPHAGSHKNVVVYNKKKTRDTNNSKS